MWLFRTIVRAGHFLVIADIYKNTKASIKVTLSREILSITKKQTVYD